MKVVGFIGSPRKNGNTDILVQQVLEGASAAGAETKVFYLNDLKFKGCQHCGYCRVHDKCGLQDDMTSLYEEINSADGIVIGSPVYMFNITGQAKLFLDRWYAYLSPDYSSRLAKGKKAALVFAQGNADVNRFRQNLETIAQGLGFLDIDVQGTLLAPGLLEPGAVVNDEILLQQARDLGNRLATK